MIFSRILWRIMAHGHKEENSFGKRCATKVRQRRRSEEAGKKRDRTFLLYKYLLALASHVIKCAHVWREASDGGYAAFAINA